MKKFPGKKLYMFLCSRKTLPKIFSSKIHSTVTAINVQRTVVKNLSGLFSNPERANKVFMVDIECGTESDSESKTK